MGCGTNHKAGIRLSEVYAGGVEVCPLVKSREDHTGAQNDAGLHLQIIVSLSECGGPK